MKKYIKYIAILILNLFVFNVQNVSAANSSAEDCKKDKKCEVICSGTFDELRLANASQGEGLEGTYYWNIFQYKNKDKWRVEAIEKEKTISSLIEKGKFDNIIGEKDGSYKVFVPNSETRKGIQKGKCPTQAVLYFKSSSHREGGIAQVKEEISKMCLANDLKDCYNAFGDDLNEGGISAVTSENGESVRIVLPEIDEVDDSCEGILDEETTEFIKKLLTFVRYGGVIIALLLSTLDLIKAVSSGSQEDLTKAMKRFGKRMIFAALLFFVALIVGILLDIFGITVAEGCSL